MERFLLLEGKHMATRCVYKRVPQATGSTHFTSDLILLGLPGIHLTAHCSHKKSSFSCLLLVDPVSVWNWVPMETFWDSRPPTGFSPLPVTRTL